MPTDHRLRFENFQGIQHARNKTIQPSKYYTIDALASHLAARAGAQKYSQIRLSRPEAVTAANATRNAVIRSLSIVPENVARILGSYIATARETPPDLTRSRDAPRK